MCHGRSQPLHGADSAEALADRTCIFDECVSTDRHWHFGFPGGYDDPDDPTGPPIPFTSEPAPGVRDYNGALLTPWCAACSLPAKPGDTYCAGHARLMEYTDHERSGGIAANE